MCSPNWCINFRLLFTHVYFNYGECGWNKHVRINQQKWNLENGTQRANSFLFSWRQFRGVNQWIMGGLQGLITTLTYIADFGFSQGLCSHSESVQSNFRHKTWHIITHLGAKKYVAQLLNQRVVNSCNGDKRFPWSTIPIQAFQKYCSSHTIFAYYEKMTETSFQNAMWRFVPAPIPWKGRVTNYFQSKKNVTYAFSYFPTYKINSILAINVLLIINI